MFTTKIIEKVTKKHFKILVKERLNDIRVSPHAFDHLSEAQRIDFGEEELKEYLLKKIPSFICRQQNGRYSVFYKEKRIFLNLIVEIREGRLDIVNFMNKDKLPVLRQQNDRK